MKMKHFAVNKGYVETAYASCMLLSHTKGFKTEDEAREDLIKSFLAAQNRVNKDIELEIDRLEDSDSGYARDVRKNAKSFLKKSLADFIEWYMNSNFQDTYAHEAWEALALQGWDFCQVQQPRLYNIENLLAYASELYLAVY